MNSTYNIAHLGVLFPFFRFESSNSALGDDWNDCLILVFLILVSKALYKQVDFQVFRGFETCSANIHTSAHERSAVSFSLEQRLFLLTGNTVLFKKRHPYLSLTKGLEKPGPLSWLLSSACCISPSPAVCRGRYGTMLFSIGSATGDYCMRLWQMDIPIKFFSRVGHSINHWHHPNPSETLGHFFLVSKKWREKTKDIL